MGNSGIFSLAGYAYQIKVFILYLLQLDDDCTIGYETFDDVALNKSDNKFNKQEKKLHTYNGLIKTPSKIIALQVKHTKLSSDDYEKVLFNWIILKSQNDNVVKFILLVDKKYKNDDITFPNDLKPLFNKIIASAKSQAALITKVKNIINNDYTIFCNLCNNIKENYEFKEVDNIDDIIYENYKQTFNHGGVMETVYRLRIHELSKVFASYILDSIIKNNDYTCKYDQFKHVIEEINSSIRDDEYRPLSFIDFKKTSQVDMDNTNILNSRQYTQLLECKLTSSSIEEYLIMEEYYNYYKLRNLENLNTSKINDIENLTHFNFEMTKTILIQNGNDSPVNRLTQTIDKDNSYATNTHIRRGSAIHLTKEGTADDLLISWKDD